MDFDDIFEAYYTQYRAEAQTPTSTEDEYTIGMRFANDAVKRWANYDGTFWKELYGTDTSKTVVADTKTYTAPTDFKEAGGAIKFLNASGDRVKNVPIVEPEQGQFYSDQANYCYFTGSPATGYTLNLSFTPDTSNVGDTIEYVYYKKPTEFTTGTDKTEVPIPEFIIYHMLALRFRASRNWSAYQTSKRDAEDVLATMKIDNNSGTWANPWKVADNSGSAWGV